MGILDVIAGELITLGACAGVSFALVGFTAAAALDEEGRNRALPVLFGLAVLGAATGITGGLSREGVVGDIIPAALGLIGSVAAYTFGIKTEGDTASRVAFAAASFALALSFGYAVGANKRTPADVLSQHAQTCQTVFSSTEILSNEAAFVRAVDIHGKICASIFATQMLTTFDVEGSDQTDADGRAITKEEQRQSAKDIWQTQYLLGLFQSRNAAEARLNEPRPAIEKSPSE